MFIIVLIISICGLEECVCTVEIVPSSPGLGLALMSVSSVLLIGWRQQSQEG